jgi:hypothetical protein
VRRRRLRDVHRGETEEEILEQAENHAGEAHPDFEGP